MRYLTNLFRKKLKVQFLLATFVFSAMILVLTLRLSDQIVGEGDVRRCHEKRNFVFIKCMKTAGTTTMGLLRRFGVRRDLSIVTPTKTHLYINWPFPLTSSDYRPSQRGYNMLIDHAVFAEKEMSDLMPPDTVYISSIRHPLAHLKSTFAYFKIPLAVGIPEADQGQNPAKSQNPVEVYFSDPERYEAEYMKSLKTDHNIIASCIPHGFSLTKNPMSHCLGMPLGFPPGQPDISKDEIAIKTYLEYLERKFSLIIIVEHFDESLVLLKRLMCWQLSDILYVSIHVLKYDYKHARLSPRVKRNHRRWDSIDYQLYDYFNASLWRKIKAQSSDFHDEVKAFKVAQERVRQYCWAVANLKDGNNVPVYLNETRVPESQWADQFSVTPRDCFYLSDPYRHLQNLQIMSDKNDAELIRKQERYRDNRILKGKC